jgi:hypothetical protein
VCDCRPGAGVVAVTTSVVPPVIPRTGQARHAGTGSSGRRRAPLPVPALDPGSARAVGIVYAVSAVDKSGRVADRNVVRAMGWAPGTRVSIRERAGTIVVAPDLGGVHRIDDRGHLLLPLAVRRGCHLTAGDRLLFAADPAAGVLVGHCFAVLDRLLADIHTAVAGGEAA